ncbi:MAG: hypothetical protein PHQ28_13935 [Mycobacterium sp.]|nr:hypothetical protein [Mycobacterium sp.]
MTNEHNEIPELTDAQKIRWQAITSDLDDMADRIRNGIATEEDIHAALNRLASSDIDPQLIANALLIPADAGPYTAALEQILRRIPDGWGRWISHDAGWYPIIASLDARLASLDPNYVVHQVKEKFGTLRYYCEPSTELRTKLRDGFKGAISDAQRASAITCERCGKPGVLHTRNHWRKTLCPTCAATLGYVIEPR